MHADFQPPLVEREAEAAAFDALIAAARSGGRLALVEGPPGIGKTRLLADARLRARAAGMDVLSARGTELELELSFGVVRQLFEPVLSAVDADEVLGGPAAPAAGVLDPARPIEVTHTGASFSTLHALYWVTANLASRAPLLLCMDDLHWCDLPSTAGSLTCSRAWRTCHCS